QRTAGWFLKRTTPSGPSKKASRHFLEGAATPPNLGGVLDLRLTWGMVNGETSNEQPLWAARNQEERLRELVGNPPDLKEKPLRRDVSSLGRLLGNVIKEQEGQHLFETVESLRTLSIAGRAGESAPDMRDNIVRRISVAEPPTLPKAF